jgi:hypothetical protein
MRRVTDAGRLLGQTTRLAASPPAVGALALVPASCLLAVAALAVATVLGPSPAAAAKPRTVVHPARYELALVAASTNDYSVGFFGNSHGRMTVLASFAGDYVSYELPATVTGDRMEAHFGDTIDISVTFQGTRSEVEPLSPPRDCTGRPSVITHGEFVGTIEFHGELGYTEVVESRHKGTREQDFRQVCHPGAPTHSRAHATASTIGPPARQLVAVHTEAGAKTWFRALTGEADAKAYPLWTFEAERTERLGEVTIGRQITVESETGGALSAVGSHRARGGVTPPAPFFGGAEYREGAGTGTWTGSLGVDFPGLANVPLTGEGFKALTCVGEGRVARRCDRSSPLGVGYP